MMNDHDIPATEKSTLR